MRIFSLFLALFLCYLPVSSFADLTVGVLPFTTPKLDPSSSLPGSYAEAPQGGSLHLAATGTEYTTLNPFVDQGVPAASSARLYATLMHTPLEDLGTAYPYAAQTVTVSPDHTSLTFNINPHARFEDGSCLTAEDALFSLSLLQEKGLPEYRLHYKDLKGRALSPHILEIRRTDGKPLSQDTLFVVAQLPLFSRHNPSLSSGPYRLSSATQERLTYQRNRPWWGNQLKAFQGLYNFDTLVFHYFSNPEASFLAFQKKNLDARFEERALTWKKKYTFGAVSQGLVRLKELPPPYALGYNALFFNLDHAPLNHLKVRQALLTALDFEWINHHLLWSSYQRNQTLFLGDSPRVLQEVPWGKDLRKARLLLQEGGCTWEKGRCLYKGTPLSFTLVLNRPGSVRLFVPYQEALKELGIRLNIRLVDGAHFMKLKKSGSYDLLLETRGPHLSPGGYGADWDALPDKKVQKALGEMRSASSPAHYRKATQALDKALYEGVYFVPLWHRPTVWVAHWTSVGLPDHGVARAVFDRWWHT